MGAKVDSCKIVETGGSDLAVVAVRFAGNVYSVTFLRRADRSWGVVAISRNGINLQRRASVYVDRSLVIDPALRALAEEAAS